MLYTAKSSEAITISIEDITGKQLLLQSLASGAPATIDVSHLANGVYLYRISEGNNVMMIGKMVKE